MGSLAKGKPFRAYPMECQSSHCGRTECGGCPRKPNLDKFKQWVKDNNATRDDPIWLPTIYYANAIEKS